VQSWEVTALDVAPRAPQILSTTAEARTIAIDLPAGERMQEHEVHERAFLVVVAGEVEVGVDGTARSCGAGTLVEFDPRERHDVLARRHARLLLVLTPWPGDGHPGAMTLEQKRSARERAAAHREAETGGAA
jgi:quercetin dioxygenase-like cupin family protein